MIATHTGPLPSVNDFAGYDDVLPGAADRIVQMAEKLKRPGFSSASFTALC
ncbi:DUF2335 domain-containing protein [Corynebacterium striatum]